MSGCVSVCVLGYRYMFRSAGAASPIISPKATAGSNRKSIPRAETGKRGLRPDWGIQEVSGLSRICLLLFVFFASFHGNSYSKSRKARNSLLVNYLVVNYVVNCSAQGALVMPFLRRKVQIKNTETEADGRHRSLLWTKSTKLGTDCYVLYTGFSSPT